MKKSFCLCIFYLIICEHYQNNSNDFSVAARILTYPNGNYREREKYVDKFQFQSNSYLQKIKNKKIKSYLQFQIENLRHDDHVVSQTHSCIVYISIARKTALTHGTKDEFELSMNTEHSNL